MDTILIIGNYDTFTKKLINKFHLEKWNIYTLTNNKKIFKPTNVIEQYVFDYKTDSVYEIIKSCSPDVIIYAGAYDTSYKWDRDNEKDPVIDYTADLSNVLISASKQGVKHFIYLSSDIVFEDEYMVEINEEMPVSPRSNKSIAISLGENIALHFGKASKLEVTVVRLDNMYSIPLDLETCNDLISKMCIEAMVKGSLKVNGKKVFSALYVKDAVEALYLLISANERKHNTYHISSREEITEDRIAQLIKDNYLHPIDIIDETIGLKNRIVLSNERFCSEFPFDIRNNYEDIIPIIVSYINKNKKYFLYDHEAIKAKREKNQLINLFRKAIPFIECIIIFLPTFFLSHGFIKNQYIANINFYLLYVLLFAIVYGRQQAIFASLLSVIGHILSLLLNPSNSSFYIDEFIYIKIAQIFVVGLSVGHLKDKYIEKDKEMYEEIDFLKERLNDIMAINTSNRKIKDYYTDKIISSRESIGRIYDITSKINKADKGEVLFVALDVLKEIMETDQVSIYLVSNMMFCRLASASSPRAASLGKSFSMDEYHMIFDELRLGQVYVNRTLDDKFPMMASALFDDENNMRIVILLWNLPYERMTLYNTNLLTVVGALVYSAFVRDANYMDALAYRRYIPETTILQEDAFKEMIDIYKRAGEKGYSESCLLYIDKESMSIKEINDKIRPMLRETDYIGIMSDKSLAVLLTNTNDNESIHVRERLGKANIKTFISYNI